MVQAVASSDAPIDPEASGEHVIGCVQAASKRGIHGLSPCCPQCHHRDGLQAVYIGNELVSLCCTAITEIMVKWPTSLRYVDATSDAKPGA